MAQYSQNRCYNYLLKRNFGENSYKGLGIFRKLDAWAARCVNFSENYQNQKILKALLKESQSRYDIKKGLYQAALEPKENKERIVENNLHLPQLRSELAQTEQMLAHYKKQKEKTIKISMILNWVKVINFRIYPINWRNFYNDNLNTPLSI